MTTELKLGGTALLASVAVLVIGFVVIASRGQIRGLGAGFMGVEGIGGDAAALSTLMKALALGAILQILGFGVLASALSRSGEGTLGLVSFGLWVFASAAAVIRGVSEGTLTAWAGNHWAETGAVPEIYEPLNAFAQQSFLWFAEVPWAIAAAGFGWAVIRSGVLPAWMGYVVVGWSALWLLFPLLFRFDLPAFLLLYPIIFGFGMILSESGP